MLAQDISELLLEDTGDESFTEQGVTQERYGSEHQSQNVKASQAKRSAQHQDERQVHDVPLQASYQYQMAHGGPTNTNIPPAAGMDAYGFSQDWNVYAGQYTETDNAFVGWSSDWYGPQEEPYSDLLSTAFDEQNLFTGLPDHDVSRTTDFENANLEPR